MSGGTEPAMRPSPRKRPGRLAQSEMGPITTPSAEPRPLVSLRLLGRGGRFSSAELHLDVEDGTLRRRPSTRQEDGADVVRRTDGAVGGGGGSKMKERLNNFEGRNPRESALKTEHVLMRQPRNCLRTTRISAGCNYCGVRTATIHSPIQAGGFYCPSCCPECNVKAREQEDCSIRPDERVQV
jgi:hypothetical protein